MSETLVRCGIPACNGDHDPDHFHIRAWEREPEHTMDGFCWCQPLAERDDVTGNYLFIHRRSLDHPHIEVEE